MYIAYRCKICGKTFILLVDEVTHSEQESRYITCPFNGKHKSIIVTGRYDDLAKCQEEHDIYKRVSGRIRQVK